MPISKKSSDKFDNLYALPSSTEFDSTLSSSEDEDTEETTDSTTTDSSPTKQWDLHTIDTTSIYFKSLPLEVKHEILTDLKDTRKQNTWAKLHLFPKQSDDFSSYQMKRLLKRQEVQSALEDVSKEMGGMSLSLAELESLLNDQGVKTTNDSNIGKRIASDENTRYLYIKNLQEELKNAEEKEQIKNLTNIDEEEELKKAIQLSLEEAPDTIKTGVLESKKKTKADMEEEEELQKAIQLSLEETPSTSVGPKLSEFSFLSNFNDADFKSDSDEDLVEETKTSKQNLKKLSSAESYMLEYSGLTRNEIDKIISKSANKISIQKSAVETLPKEISNKDAFKDVAEATVTINLEDEKPEEDLQNKQSSRVLEVIAEEETEDIKCAGEVEIMSDSDESSSNEIELPKSKLNLEIIIDPNKKDDDGDDLFGDIFEKDTNTENIDNTKEVPVLNKPIEIIINPNKSDTDNDDLFGDIFIKDKLTENKEDHQKASTSDGLNENGPGKIETVKDNITIAKQKIVSIQKNEDIVINKSSKETAVPKISRKEMEELQENLQKEKIDLLKEKSTKERLANNITDQMYQEAQELLELFGVPYIIAPMEAEAQCAFLDENELTNGSITDDSDIWLFGGRTVYKNFFNQSKYVMEFKSENIEHHFKLTRQQMILLALLVGSDYTTGIQGVGPVTALEILASFPPAQSKEFKLTHHQLVTGLKEFKSWFMKGKAPGPGRSGLKSKLKNIAFADGFPNSQVVEAYLEPKVDSNKDTFSWSKPDVTSLTVFATEKFGWTMKKTEEILNPVIKKIEENQTQKTIKDYFKTKFKINPVDLEGKVSKRVKTAIDKIGKTPDELIADEMAELEKEKEREIRKTKGGGSKKSNSTRNKRKAVNDTKGDKNQEEIDSQMTENAGNSLEEKLKDTAQDKPKVLNRRRNASTKKNIEKDLKEDTNNEVPPKRSRKKKETNEINTSKSLEEMDNVKDYENLAVELKTRRKRRNELMKIKIEDLTKKKPKIQPPTENIPKELAEDAEIKLLEATTSQSNKRIEEIKNEVLHSLEKPVVKKNIPIPTTSFHTKEVIHQKLRDKSDVLRNKLKAIEVYRKSTKGPGYVPKRTKKVAAPKEDAGLSEDSD